MCCVITVYGAMWCGDCRRSKRFLDGKAVPYEWIDVESDAEAADYVREVNGGRKTIPTIVFPDGAVLVEPTDEELGAKLGITMS